MVLMTEQSVVPKKRRGPTPTGKGVQIQVRLQPDDLAKLDLWIEANAIGVSRPEAIRQILHAMIGMLDRDRIDQEEKRQRETERAGRAATRKLK